MRTITPKSTYHRFTSQRRLLADPRTSATPELSGTMALEYVPSMSNYHRDRRTRVFNELRTNLATPKT